MKVAIHQPHFLPWLGYLHRMAQADLFVLLDHVQFERRNYQNRTMIRLADQGHWLTVPVVQNSQKERIVDKLVDNRLDGTKWWSANHFATLRHAYRAAPFFDVYAPSMQRLFETKWQRLVDINQAGLELLREAYGITTPLARSSVMVLSSKGGVCSAVVVAPDVVLTAAHCVAGAPDHRVHWRGEAGEPVLRPSQKRTAARRKAK